MKRKIFNPSRDVKMIEGK